MRVREASVKAQFDVKIAMLFAIPLGVLNVIF